MNKNFYFFLLALLMGAVITISCSDDKYKYDEEKAAEYAQQVAMAKYTSNFVSAFGDISNIQSWDFSTDKARLATRATNEISCTEVPGLSYADGLNSNIQTDVEKQLPAGKRYEGETVVMLAPSSSFTIYPIYTNGTLTYDVNVQITDVSNGNSVTKKIFSKTWSQTKFTYNGSSVNSSGTLKANMPGVSISAPLGSRIDIILTVTDNNASHDVYTIGTTTGNAMLVSSNERPQGLDESIMPEDAIIKYVGIEDRQLSDARCDHDHNDLTFVLVGRPDVPQLAAITEKKEYTVEVAHPSKRYMVEDLGTTDDFDFNDIVIDVEEVEYEKHAVVIVDGDITSDEVVGDSIGQAAYVRAMGGTFDFDIKIGNDTYGYTTWKKSAEYGAATMYNTSDPDYDLVLAKIPLGAHQWNSDDNNITIHVLGEDATNVRTINFSDATEQHTAPLIIAVDCTQKWSKERERADWIKDLMNKAQ